MISGKPIYQDDLFLVLWGDSLRDGFGHSLFARIYVHLKHRNLTIEIGKRERAFLMMLIAEFKKRGRIRDVKNHPCLREFADAIAVGQNGALWQVLFNCNTPGQFAKENLDN